MHHLFRDQSLARAERHDTYCCHIIGHGHDPLTAAAAAGRVYTTCMDLHARSGACVLSISASMQEPFEQG
jgi:hypothetical protein